MQMYTEFYFKTANKRICTSQRQLAATGSLVVAIR